jgi:hypothetical protein
MCEATTLMVASMAIGAASAYVSYDTNKQAGKVQEAMAENNARLAADDAANAMAMGDRESEQQTWRTRAILGQQRAAVAAQGIDPTMGTPLELLGETAMFGEVDQQTIRLNAARNAWGFRAQETNIRNQSALDRYTTKQKGNATILSGLSSMAGSASSFYGSR